MKSKGFAMVAAIACAAAAMAAAFFEPQVTNPIARSTTCTMQLRWNPADPEAVEVADVSVLGSPWPRCRATEALAYSTALVRSIKASTPPQ